MTQRMGSGVRGAVLRSRVNGLLTAPPIGYPACIVTAAVDGFSPALKRREHREGLAVVSVDTRASAAAPLTSRNGMMARLTRSRLRM
jgi:hypothetical protein